MIANLEFYLFQKIKKVSHYIIININEGYFRMEDIINNKQIIDKEKVRRL